MISSGALKELRAGPSYFFDQPTGRDRKKVARFNALPFHLADEGLQLETVSDPETEADIRTVDQSTERLSGETSKLDTTSFAVSDALNVKNRDPLKGQFNTYKRAAPHILNQLALLLSQHKWTEKGCIPQAIMNILNYSWQDLIAGAVYLKSSDPSGKQAKFKAPLSPEETLRQVSVQEKRKTGEKKLAAVRNVGKCERKPEVHPDSPRKKQLSSTSRARTSTTINFSISSSSFKEQGWIIQPPCDEFQRITLCQWVVDRLQKARIYPSGCMAVCQSHSGLPRGGFYTNVFSDGKCPAILATITASGHGAVTHPHSSAITAMWNQDGGFMCDPYGNVTKKWTWQVDLVLTKKIIIQLSDLIYVRLLSGTSAMLSFRCNSENVHLPLSVLPNQAPSGEMIEQKLTSDAAQELADKRRTPSLVIRSKRSLTLTPEVFQMVKEEERLDEPSAQWRGGGHAGKVLKRLQQRIRNTVDDWMDYYRMATGIKCPDMERMPYALPRTRLRSEVESAALPSLNPPEQAEVKPTQLEEGPHELQKLSRHLTSKKQIKEEHITQIQPLEIRTNVKLESVIIPKSPQLQPSAVKHSQVQPSFIPSVPLTVCPALLRAALLGEGRQRLCRCSSRLMPLVTDLEYDTFIMGQPPHSEQILVVCVTPLPPFDAHIMPNQDKLEQLYRRRNKDRSMPCTQCRMDSFRLVKYEMSTGWTSSGEQNILLQQRHNAAPGTILMYIRGKLLFAGNMLSGCSGSVKDLHKQISRSRGDYRLGLSLPADYKLSEDPCQHPPPKTQC
ncbi:hypothetical protein LDENG_00255930 [Lucifuga dentata]|nr:hypothetical protein LDENG_00255930 [Lucifuga dentata]